MRRTGVILILVGLLIAGLATAQFELVLFFTSDPNPNPAINGVLMWAGWGLGGLLVAIGALVALVGLARRPRHGSGG